ncbi:hypothetical protein [Sneathiella litorea]|uniref:Uncharacterized protein n=1 Tax=Sneathiella litorea TaxID=2606216 RepID=A0A6L8W336_9PROT|nr:hypothetical protein [Sneathiella litorea]MZR29486.1 hypothetical protein [Sneathiella litorea]
MLSPLQIVVLALFPLGLSSCSVIDDTLLTEEVSDFSLGVVALSSIIQTEFSLAEDVNTLGFTDYLQFQLELGGNPNTNLKPLFSVADIAARRDLLAGLDGYADTLTAVASEKSPSEGYSVLDGTLKNLKLLDYGDFNLSHSLSFLNSNQLVNDISFLDELLILPERDRRLLPILEKGGETLKKMALLLYFDIGAIADQSSKCRYTYPENDFSAKMSSLRLCKGGLRSIVSSAVKFDTNIWKDKLAYLKGHEAGSSKIRRDAINRLVSIQKLGQSMDQLLSETQLALIAMIDAHEAIEATLRAAQKSSIVSFTSTTKIILFRKKLRELLKAAANVQNALSELSGTTMSPQDFLPTDFTQNGTGENNGE